MSLIIIFSCVAVNISVNSIVTPDLNLNVSNVYSFHQFTVAPSLMVGKN